jgi:hypothetical protein
MKITPIVLLIIFLLPLISLSNVVKASDTLYEYNDLNAKSEMGVYGVYWRGENFSIGLIGSNTAHYLTSVKLRLYNTNAPTTKLYVKIYATDGTGKKTGGILTQAYMDTTSVRSETLYEITGFTPSYTLQASNIYFMEINSSDSTATNYVHIRLSYNPTTYKGLEWASSDSGVSWTSYTTYDFDFYEYGIANAIPTLSYINPVSTTYGVYNPSNMLISKLTNISFKFLDTDDSNLYYKLRSNVSGTWKNIRTGLITQNVDYNLQSITNFTLVNQTSWFSVNVSDNYTSSHWINTTRHFYRVNCSSFSLIVYNNTVNVTGKYQTSYNYLTGNKIWMNYTGIKTSCGNTSLTVYNNTVNVTGKYQTSYNSLTGNKIWMNFTGFCIGGNITGISDNDFITSTSSVFLFTMIGLFVVKRRKRKI